MPGIDAMAAGLRQLGLVEGGVAMVHASMRKVGGRAEDLLESLLTALGPSGTVLAYLDFETTPEVPEFDLLRSPAALDHGIFAEVLRRDPRSVRSANPGASMGAIGARAKWLCRDHPLDYGYGPGTPLARLLDADGQVLLLGAELDHTTLIHHAEHLAKLAHKRIVRFTHQGREHEELDTSDPVCDGMPENLIEQIVAGAVAHGLAKTGRIGGAQSQLFSARELTRFAIDWMERRW